MLIMKNTEAKAKELIEIFAIGGWGKVNALKCVDEILNSGSLTAGWAKDVDLPLRKDMKPYWEEVRNYIINSPGI